MKKAIVFLIFFLLLQPVFSYAMLKEVSTKNLVSIIEKSKGKVFILMFWSIWCPLCIKELKVLEELQSTYGEKKLKIVSVCLDRESDKIQNLLKKKGIKLFVLIAKEDVKVSFNIVGVPKIYIFDKRNEAIKWQMGYIDKSTLIDIIKDLI